MSVSLTLNLYEVRNGLWAWRKQASFQRYFAIPSISKWLHYLTQKRTLIRTSTGIDDFYSQSLAGRDFKRCPRTLPCLQNPTSHKPLIESWWDNRQQKVENEGRWRDGSFYDLPSPWKRPSNGNTQERPPLKTFLLKGCCSVFISQRGRIVHWHTLENRSPCQKAMNMNQ